ncbi:methanol O-anthraniloyltransferase [Vigna angularis]|uniref:methanol O-anthraniloyltransferase n=1 Tax=Phaseolus angularis TaxID=3914 RepID=UPI000809CDD7|nr:methanol O-anthraniloyltransferase [Vigna angularis]
MSPRSFAVVHGGAELVMPAGRTPRELKKLSDIDDEEGLRFHLPVIMFYRNGSVVEGKDVGKVIRNGLSKALVYYYPLAGRLREGPNRKLMVDCNGEGMLLVEAEADDSLRELGDKILPPCPYMKEFLLDVPGSPRILGTPLLFQVTRLTCGGFVFAARMNHTICDSLGLVQFLTMVGEIARGASITQFPVWQRELFSARNPPRITCAHNEYETQHCQKETWDTHEMDHGSFFFGPKEIATLRSHLPMHLQNSSTFEVLSACLWKCRTIALGLKPNETVGLSPFITARGKLGQQVPNGYYGNAFAFPMALARAGPLCQNPLGYALELVKKAKAQMGAEYVSSVADLMVLKGRPKYRTEGNYLIGDTTHVGFYEVDFGWGSPIYGGPAGAIPFVSFYGRFRNSEGEDVIVVPILLPHHVMRRFLSELVKITNKDPMDFSDENMPNRSMLYVRT